MRSLRHIKQLMNDKKFRKFDFGPEDNERIYDEEEPPTFDLSEIKGINISMICGQSDQISSPADCRALMTDLLKKNSLNFKEFKEGHLGLLMPVDTSSTDYMFT